MPNMHTHYLVRNVIGTTGRQCRCGYWLDHWDKHAGQNSRRKRCSAFGCSEPVADGAHVILLDNLHDWSNYIVPLCSGCNHRGCDFWINKNVVLVPANTQELGCYL